MAVIKTADGRYMMEQQALAVIDGKYITKVWKDETGCIHCDYYDSEYDLQNDLNGTHTNDEFAKKAFAEIVGEE